MANNLPNYSFRVEYDGQDIACQKVRNLARRTELILSRRGDSRLTVDDRAPGRSIYENVILEKTALKGDETFLRIIDENERPEVAGQIPGSGPGAPSGKTLVVQLLDAEFNPVIRWLYSNVIPVRFSYSDLDATGNSFLMERLEFSCELLRIEYLN